MEKHLSGKVAVVTGGGNGVGRGIALHMAEQGAGVIVSDIGREPSGELSAQKVVKEIADKGGQAAACAENVATMQGGEAIVGEAIAQFGRIDALVCCAGNMIRKTVLDMTEQDWDAIQNVHLKGHFACAKAAAVHMVKQNSGSIVCVSSRSASGPGGSCAYAAAKAGIIGLALALALELKEYGISVNTLLPSADTQLFPGERPKPPPGHRGLPAALHIGPENIAPLIGYLATDKGRAITGQIFYAAGGDICIYTKPLDVPGESTNMFLRTPGKWTIEELGQVMPSMFGIS